MPQHFPWFHSGPVSAVTVVESCCTEDIVETFDWTMSGAKSGVTGHLGPSHGKVFQYLATDQRQSV